MKKKAFEFYQKALQFGEKEAYYHLGICYLEGKGVKQDKGKAIALLVLVEDQYNLAAYLIGQYFKEMHDTHEAIRHFKIAIQKEDEEQSLYQLALYGEQGIEISEDEMMDYLLRSD